MLGGQDSRFVKSEELLKHISESNGDLGLVRPLIDKKKEEFNDYSYGSIVIDGVSTNNQRTGGLPQTSTFDRVVFLSANGVGYTLYIASTNVNDTALGTGARKVFLQGLDNNWKEQSEEITLNGQTPVATTKTNWLRINKMFVSQVDTNGTTNLGDIYISSVNNFTLGVPQVDIIHAIKIGYGYSVMGSYTVPFQTRLYFTRGSYYSDATATASLINEQIDIYPWDTKNPNTNRIKLVVGKLYSSNTVAFNTSGSAPEYPTTDIEFTIQSGKTNQPVNFSIFWNTIRVKDTSF